MIVAAICSRFCCISLGFAGVFGVTGLVGFGLGVIGFILI